MAARIFADDNNDQWPGAQVVNAADYFLILTNELSTPKIVHCPADKMRQASVDFANFTTQNISYFASLSAVSTSPEMFLFGDRNLMADGRPLGPGRESITPGQQLSWTKQLHVEQGNIARGDGSVQMYSLHALSRAQSNKAFATNLLLFP